MGKLRDVVKSYFEAQEQIFEAFDTSGWEEINSHIGERWHRYESHGDFHYLDEQNEEYSFETTTQISVCTDM